MEVNKEYTLIIHGPISLFTLLSLYRYKEEYPIVLVMPKPSDSAQAAFMQHAQQIASDTNYKINLLTYTPEVNKQYNNLQNRYLHFFSVALGLEVCRTPYTIKLRSDEFYSNLKPFTDAVMKSSTKIVTNDVFFRNPKVHAIHPSDHLVGGKTDTLKSVFTLAKTYCEDEKLLKSNLFSKSVMANKELEFTAEQTLGLAAIAVLVKDKKIDVMNENEVVSSIFEIVTSDKLGFFRIGSNSQKIKEYFDTTYFNKETDINDIREYNNE